MLTATHGLRARLTLSCLLLSLSPRVASAFLFFFLSASSVQVEHAEICEEYEGQMKELEEILASGPASANVSVEQLVKQVSIFTCVFVCVCNPPATLRCGYPTHTRQSLHRQHSLRLRFF